MPQLYFNLNIFSLNSIILLGYEETNNGLSSNVDHLTQILLDSFIIDEYIIVISQCSSLLGTRLSSKLQVKKIILPLLVTVHNVLFDLH